MGVKHTRGTSVTHPRTGFPTEVAQLSFFEIAHGGFLGLVVLQFLDGSPISSDSDSDSDSDSCLPP